MRRIILSNTDLVALIDDDDFLLIAGHRWFKWRNRNIDYAKTEISGKKYLMHQLLIPSVPLGYLRDHVDGNGLNNQRDNLQVITYEQNEAKSLHLRKNPFGFKGVYWHKCSKRYFAQISVKGRIIHLGQRDTPIDAAKLYNEAAVKYFGQFAVLNSIEEKSIGTTS